MFPLLISWAGICKFWDSSKKHQGKRIYCQYIRVLCFASTGPMTCKIRHLIFLAGNCNLHRPRRSQHDQAAHLGKVSGRFLTMIFTYLNQNFCDLKLLSIFIDHFPNFSNKNQEENAENDHDHNNKLLNINKSISSLAENRENKNRNKRNIIDLQNFSNNKNNVDKSNIPIINREKSSNSLSLYYYIYSNLTFLRIHCFKSKS